MLFTSRMSLVTVVSYYSVIMELWLCTEELRYIQLKVMVQVVIMNMLKPG